MNQHAIDTFIVYYMLSFAQAMVVVAVWELSKFLWRSMSYLGPVPELPRVVVMLDLDRKIFVSVRDCAFYEHQRDEVQRILTHFVGEPMETRSDGSIIMIDHVKQAVERYLHGLKAGGTIWWSPLDKVWVQRYPVEELT